MRRQEAGGEMRHVSWRKPKLLQTRKSKLGVNAEYKVQPVNEKGKKQKQEARKTSPALSGSRGRSKQAELRRIRQETTLLN